MRPAVLKAGRTNNHGRTAWSRFNKLLSGAVEPVWLFACFWPLPPPFFCPSIGRMSSAFYL